MSTPPPLARLGRRLDRGATRRSLVLLLPLGLLEALVFAVPLGYLLRLSLYGRTDSGAFDTGTVSLDGYAYLVTSPVVANVAVFTAWFATVVTVLAVVVGLVYGYAIWRADGVVRLTLLAGVVVSLLTTLVVKLFAVVLVFSPAGTLNAVLTTTGLLETPLRLVNNEVGAVIAQLYVVVPYAVLAVHSVLDGLDDQLIEAARDLGADRLTAFKAIVVPHALPGVAVAAGVSFAWSVGAYAAPLLVGSGGERTAGVHVSALLLQRYDWPAAAALAVVTVVAVAASLGAVLVAVRRRD